MKVLLTRFGGIGDCFPVAATADVLAKRGHDVTIALRDDGAAVKQSLLFKENKTFNCIDFKQIGPWSDRCVKKALGWVDIKATYKDFDFVVDYMNIVEGNSTCPTTDYNNVSEFWQRSRSSNFQNWYDLHLAWANIDPMLIDGRAKRPNLIITDDECEAAIKFRAGYNYFFVIHPFASSLARSWYQAKELVPKILKAYDNAAIAFWNPGANNWDLLTRKGPAKLPKLHENPLRETMALVSVADLVVSVDTGISHIAEGLNMKSLVIYSTVPAWTRNKYYEHQSYIDPGETNPEYHTFSLSLGDPLRVKDGLATLTEREKQVKELWERNAGVEEAMDLLNTDARGAELELKTLMARQESWERQQSKALSSVHSDEVFLRIQNIVK